MSQRAVLLITLVLFLSFPASAQTSPCDGGTPNPLFTVIPGPPVQLRFEHLSVHTVVAPTVTIAGSNITVVQLLTDLPPPPGPPPSLHCNLQTVSLGVLAPGTYNVTWIYAVHPALPGGQPQPVQTFTFSFSILEAVPALSGPALFALMLLLGSLGLVILCR